MPRLHLHVSRIEVVLSTCITCRRLHPVSATKPSSRRHVSTCTRIDYPRVEHCLELVSIYLYPSTCIWCKRGLTDLDVETDMLANVLELERDDRQTYAECQQWITRTRDERRPAMCYHIIIL